MYEEMNDSNNINNTEYTYAQPEQQIVEQPVQNEGGSGFGIAALVLGILALLTFCIPCINLLLAILSIIFAIIQLVRGNAKGLAIGGLITSILSIIACIVFYAIMGMSFSKFSDLDNYSSFMEEYNDDYSDSDDDLYDGLYDDDDDIF